MEVKIEKWTDFPGIVRREIVHAGTGEPVRASELLDIGWDYGGGMKLERGYMSRRDKEPERGPVYMAGGQRRGELYYIEPCYLTTRYRYRVYLVPGPEAEPLEMIEAPATGYPRDNTIWGAAYMRINSKARNDSPQTGKEGA